MATVTPRHYSFPIEPLTFITANSLGFCEGNIIKYVCRYPRKGGVGDLLKARAYLDHLIQQQQKREEEPDDEAF